MRKDLTYWTPGLYRIRWKDGRAADVGRLLPAGVFIKEGLDLQDAIFRGDVREIVDPRGQSVPPEIMYQILELNLPKMEGWLEERELEKKLFIAMANENIEEPWKCIGAPTRTHRDFDRCIQKLKRRGFVVYDKMRKDWAFTDEGMAIAEMNDWLEVRP